MLEIGLVVGTGRQQHDQRRTVAASAPSAAATRARHRRTTPDAAHADRETSAERRARRSAGFPAHSRPPTAPACGHRPPTSCHPANAPDRPRSGTGGRRQAAAHAAPDAGSRCGRRSPAAGWRRCAAVSAARRYRPAPGSTMPARWAMPSSMPCHSVGRQEQRQRIDFPWPVGSLRIGIDVVGDAALDGSRVPSATASRGSPDLRARAASARIDPTAGAARPSAPSSSS